MMTSTAVHLTLAILWIGVLLTFLAAVFTSTGKRPSESTKWFGVQTLKWLSMMGLLVLAAVFVTGLTSKTRELDRKVIASTCIAP